MRVRFENGLCVVYNEATYASRHDRYTDLYTRREGAWIAQVPNSAIIEVRPACAVHFEEPTRGPGEVAMLRSEVRGLRRQMAAFLAVAKSAPPPKPTAKRKRRRS